MSSPELQSTYVQPSGAEQVDEPHDDFDDEPLFAPMAAPHPTFFEGPSDSELAASRAEYERYQAEKAEANERAERELAALTPEDWDRLWDERERREAEEAERARTPILFEAPQEVQSLLSLNHEVTDYEDIHDVASALVGVPMLTAKFVEEHTIDRGSEGYLEDDVTVPMSRIVGVGTFETWAGRGFEKDHETIINKDSISSLREIAICADLGQMDQYHGTGGAPKLNLFEDADGEIWAYTYADGSHRTAGAKARGDQYLSHAIVHRADVLPRVNFSVAQVLREQVESGVVGQRDQPVNEYLEQYVAASEDFDANSPNGQEYIESQRRRKHEAQPLGATAISQEVDLDEWI